MRPRPSTLEALRRYLRPEWFRALCEPTRVEILGRLLSRGEPSTVSEAASCCGIHLSGVSRHLAVLRDAGLVTAERRGREVLYQFDRDRVTTTLRALADAIDGHAPPPPLATERSEEERR
ncbi:MAG: metalloregulator ArsR/SmtB family transcription factor [Planctomycetota bacterium]|nr:metalloregulator ArsR/SmtB family transcription factor [Planctomycetota bacterium]